MNDKSQVKKIEEVAKSDDTEKDKKEPLQLTRAALVSESLMQALIDVLRDHVPHKVADPLLKDIRSVQYGQFPVSKK